MALLENKTVLIIGSGPNVIGQSDECDQGALEACLVLKEMGCRLVAVNSNPDSPMTDSSLAQRTYLEPLTLETLERIIAEEKPHAIVPGFGGRTALHVTVQMAQRGILDRHGVAVWGTAPRDLERLLDRDALSSAVGPIDLNTPSLFSYSKLDEAEAKAQEIGFPVVLRSDSHLMPDGVLAYNQEEIRTLAAPLTGEQAFSLSVESSLRDWQQLEIEILRDNRGEVRIAGGVEYLDSAVVHPGDAIAVSPPQCINEKALGRLIEQARIVAGHLNIMGGVTIRVAFAPHNGSFLLLAVHPRYTRTSALSALIAGRPIARTAVLLASGLSWDQLPAGASFEPPQARDFAVVGVKWPVWDFGHLDGISDRLGPRMQAVGQAVGLGAGFKEALQNAARSANPGCTGLGDSSGDSGLPLEDLLARVAAPNSGRMFQLYEALRRGAVGRELSERSMIQPGFIEQLGELAALEEQIRAQVGSGGQPDPGLWRKARQNGFSPARLRDLHGLKPERLADISAAADLPLQVQPLGDLGGHCFSTCAVGGGSLPPSSGKVVLLIGSGPHRIGSGPECDWAIVHAAAALSDMGYQPVTINTNLTGVSTGFAMPGRIYCDPMDVEDILAVIAREKPVGIITRFAGFSEKTLKRELAARGAPIAGTPIEALEIIHDHEALRGRIRDLGIPQPAYALCRSAEQLRRCASDLGYPLLVSPAKAAADRSPELIMDAAILEKYLEQAGPDPDGPYLLERFLQYAIEAQAEALCDGSSVQVAAVLEHIELAGVNAGDSAWVLPPYSIAPRHVETISEYTRKIGLALPIKGLINARFAIYRDTVYLLQVGCEVNRNLSLVSKTTGQPIVRSAVRLMLGGSLEPASAARGSSRLCGVRTAVFPFNVFSQIDPLLGTRMRSTGQVLAMADSFALAYFKAQSAAGSPLPLAGTVLITVTDEDKPSILEPARIFQELGFTLMATRGTQAALADHGIQAQTVRKLGFGRPNLADEIKNGKVQMVINTPSGEKSQMDDSYIRKAAIRYRVTHITTPASALAAAKGIAARRNGDSPMRCLQDD